MPLSLDYLPPEIWSHVFSFACTDGGFTGRSLASTSKFINTTSKSHKYKSISLHGYGDISAFNAFILGHPDIIPGVLHLFVSNVMPESQEVEDLISTSDESIYQRVSSKISKISKRIFEGSERRRELMNLHLDILGDQLCKITLRLVLTKVAPTLETLSISYTSRGLSTIWRPSHSSPPIPPMTNLSELTLSYDGLVGACFDSFIDTSNPAKSFLPSLRRLDISTLMIYDEDHLIHPDLLVQQTTALAPALTHLALGSVHAFGIECHFLSPDVSDNRPALLRVCIPLDLEHTCQGPMAEHGPCPRCLLLQAAEGDERVRLVVPAKRPHRKDVNTSMQEWMGRIEGAEGFWEGKEIVC